MTDARGPLPYVSIAGDASLAQPGRFERVTYYNYLVPARRERLEALCERVFLRPSGGAARYEPLGDEVVVSFAKIERLDSADAHKGWTSYHDIAIWVPLLALRQRGGETYGESIALYPAHIFVDEPDTLVTGRETYGFPKQRGWFQVPSDPAEAQHLWTVAWGARRRTPLDQPGAHEAREPSARHLLWEIRRVEGEGPTEWGGVPGLFNLLRAVWERLEAGELLRAARAFEPADLLQPNTITLLGMKQVRSAEGRARASYQAIVETPARVRAFRGGGIYQDRFAFVLHELASHPVAEDLGLNSGSTPVSLAFWMTLDVDIGDGREVWSSARPPAEAAAPTATVANLRTLPRPLEWLRPPAPPAQEEPVRVAILGGGLGGLTAAYELSDPRLQGRYRVCLFTRGWRLGGKCVSGRNPGLAQRNEEHGLHVWLGFYENAFALIRRVYAELGRPPEHPLATVEQAFRGHDFIAVNEEHEGRWHPWRFDFPRNNDVPGLTGHVLPDAWEILTMSLGWVLEALETLFGLEEEQTLDRVEDALRTAARPLTAPVARDELRRARSLVHRVLSFLGQLLQGMALDLLEPLIDASLVALRDLVRRLTAPLREDPQVRKLWFLTDTSLTIQLGILRDGLMEDGFEAIDHLDLREWLLKHGMEEETARHSPSVRFIYGAAFAFEEGDVTRPSLAAGAGLRGVIRKLFTYKGSLLYTMQAGMGEVVFAPFYEVLKRRGVELELFHSVEALELDEARERVARVRMVRQCEPLSDYAVLEDVGGIPCFRHEPDYAHIRAGDRLRAALEAAGTDLERVRYPLPGWETQERVLNLGKDFDEVVLAIPSGALAPITTELSAANERWRAMLAHVPSVATQAFQIWMKPSLPELGWSDPPPVFGTYVEPLDTYMDMTFLLPREAWSGPGRPRSLAYFCGVQPDVPGETPAQATERAKQAALEYVRRDLPRVWPELDRGEGVRWDLLHDPEERSGAARFDAQFWRANAAGSERYVLSTPGSIRYRLPADGSGFANLSLAGDWTDNHFNTGCLEATVMSGLQAVRAITGLEMHIVGESDAWLRGRHAPSLAPPQPSWENVSPLVHWQRVEGALVHVLFRCPQTGRRVPAAAPLQAPAPEDEPGLLASAWSSLVGFFQGAFGGWWDDDGDSGAAPAPEVQGAIVAAFARMRREFRWDRGSERWEASSAFRAAPLSPWERQLANAPIVRQRDQQLLGRLLLDVAAADGDGIEPAERAFLRARLGDRGIDATPLTREALGAASPFCRETMLMLAWALALVDGQADEQQRLAELAEWLEIEPARAARLRAMARAHLLDEGLRARAAVS